MFEYIISVEVLLSFVMNLNFMNIACNAVNLYEQPNCHVVTSVDVLWILLWNIKIKLMTR